MHTFILSWFSFWMVLLNVNGPVTFVKESLGLKSAKRQGSLDPYFVPNIVSSLCSQEKNFYSVSVPIHAN